MKEDQPTQDSEENQELKDPKQLIPCFVCGEAVELKKTKRDKPYFICEPCGVQAFIRGPKGIQLIRQLIGEGVFAGMKSQLLVQRLLRLKEKIAEIERRRGVLGLFDPELNTAQEILEKEKGQLMARIKSAGEM